MKRKIKIPGIKELFKKASKRLEFWGIFLIFGILMDEYIKEGYFFHPTEMFIPFTHEFFILLIIIGLCLKKIIEKRRLGKARK